MRSRTLRISAAEGGSEASSSSARAPEPTFQERTSRAPPGTVPRITSVEPPPTSTTPTVPSTGWPRVLVAPMKERRPSSSSLRTSTSTPAASPISLAACSPLARLAHRGGGDRADRLGAELARQADLGGDDLGDLLDLVGTDRSVVVDRLVDAGVGALLHHLFQLAVDRLRHEHARRIGADIYGGAEHPGGVLNIPRRLGSQSPALPQTRRTKPDERRPRTPGTAR